MSTSSNDRVSGPPRPAFLPVKTWEKVLAVVLFVLVSGLYIWLVPQVWGLGRDAAVYVMGGSLGAFGLGADLWSRLFHRVELRQRSKVAGWIALGSTVLGFVLTVLAPSLDPATELLPWPESAVFLGVLACLAIGGFGPLMLLAELTESEPATDEHG